MTGWMRILWASVCRVSAARVSVGAQAEDAASQEPAEGWKLVWKDEAVGGDWPGDPGPNTVFPQQRVIDDVRVYTRIPKNIDCASADREVTFVEV